MLRAAIALAGSCGSHQLHVYQRPRVAILSTGDELVDIAAEPAPNQIRNSNSYSLAAQVHAAGGDPVAWIRSQPGRIKCMHCKDWSPAPDKGYKVLFGEGAADWKNIFAAAESVGGLEYYLLEQEGSRYSELETAKHCLETFRTTHA